MALKVLAGKLPPAKSGSASSTARATCPTWNSGSLPTWVPSDAERWLVAWDLRSKNKSASGAENFGRSREALCESPRGELISHSRVNRIGGR